ncbi:MAG: hypothetical protein M3N29_04150 [Chloroflexota bacterium]|nr:hypothetical protein [Chloroflexota bacterium]
MSELRDAWAELHAATPTGWYVGRPTYHDDRAEWQMYAFDPTENAVMGKRQREWTAVAQTGRRRPRDGSLPARDERRAGADLVTMKIHLDGTLGGE